MWDLGTFVPRFSHACQRVGVLCVDPGVPGHGVVQVLGVAGPGARGRSFVRGWGARLPVGVPGKCVSLEGGGAAWGSAALADAGVLTPLRLHPGGCDSRGFEIPVPFCVQRGALSIPVTLLTWPSVCRFQASLSRERGICVLRRGTEEPRGARLPAWLAVLEVPGASGYEAGPRGLRLTVLSGLCWVPHLRVESGPCIPESASEAAVPTRRCPRDPLLPHPRLLWQSLTRTTFVWGGSESATRACFPKGRGPLRGGLVSHLLRPRLTVPLKLNVKQRETPACYFVHLRKGFPEDPAFG